MSLRDTLLACAIGALLAAAALSWLTEEPVHPVTWSQT